LNESENDIHSITTAETSRTGAKTPKRAIEMTSPFQWLIRDLYRAFMFIPSIIATIISYIYLPMMATLTIIFITIVFGFVLYIKRLHRRLRDHKGISPVANQSDNVKRILLPLTYLIKLVQDHLDTIDKEIATRDFQRLNPDVQIRVVKILVFGEKTILVGNGKALQKLVKGMKFGIFHIAPTEIERHIGVATISHVQPNGICQARIINFKERELWNGYITVCQQAGESVPSGDMTLRPMRNERLDTLNSIELLGGKKILNTLLNVFLEEIGGIT